VGLDLWKKRENAKISKLKQKSYSSKKTTFSQMVSIL
jgi:hypothetical protein